MTFVPVDPVKLLLGIANKGLLPLAFIGQEEPRSGMPPIETVPYSPQRCPMMCDWCGRQMTALVRHPVIRGNHNEFWRRHPEADDVYVCSEICGELLGAYVARLH